jgi:hypothetical protein
MSEYRRPEYHHHPERKGCTVSEPEAADAAAPEPEAAVIESEQAAVAETVRAMRDAAVEAGRAVSAAHDATRAAVVVVAEVAARDILAFYRSLWDEEVPADAACVHEAANMYQAAHEAATKYLAECEYVTVGDDEQQEYRPLVVYLTRDYLPTDKLAHEVACRALVVVSLEAAAAPTAVTMAEAEVAEIIAPEAAEAVAEAEAAETAPEAEAAEAVAEAEVAEVAPEGEVAEAVAEAEVAEAAPEAEAAD